MGWWGNFCCFCRELWCRREFRRSFCAQFCRCSRFFVVIGLFWYVMFCPSIWIIFMLMLLVLSLIIR